LLSRIGIQSIPMGFVGAISLEIYILHMKLMQVFHQFIQHEPSCSSAWLVLYFAILIGAAWLFSQFNQWLMQCLHNRPAPTPALKSK
jgi:membrane-bound acyltransferase YfiQ involved in biofilm formation